MGEDHSRNDHAVVAVDILDTVDPVAVQVAVADSVLALEEYLEPAVKNLIEINKMSFHSFNSFLFLSLFKNA